MPILEVRGLSAGYGPVRALDGVSIEVGEGETVAIIGANGAGKTTLLMAISGVVPARSGSIVFEGRPITGLPPHAVARLGVGHAPEGRRIFPRLSVRENLQLGGFSRTDRSTIAADIDEACALFPVLGERLGQMGGTLSGGEQQMLALARALVGRPKLLLLDEPSLGLAPLIVQKIFEVSRHATRTHHIFTEVSMFASARRMAGLSADNQKVIREAARRAVAEEMWAQNLREQTAAWADLASRVRAIPDPDVPSFRERMAPVISNFESRTGAKGKAFVDAVRAAA